MAEDFSPCAPLEVRVVGLERRVNTAEVEIKALEDRMHEVELGSVKAEQRLHDVVRDAVEEGIVKTHKSIERIWASLEADRKESQECRGKLSMRVEKLENAEAHKALEDKKARQKLVVSGIITMIIGWFGAIVSNNILGIIQQMGG